MLSSEEEELLSAVLVTEFPEHVQALRRKESPDRVAPAQPPEQMSAEPPQRITLTPMEIISRISDVTYEPGHRPELLQSVQSGWYKEPGKTERARRGLHTSAYTHVHCARDLLRAHALARSHAALARTLAHAHARALMRHHAQSRTRARALALALVSIPILIHLGLILN